MTGFPNLSVHLPARGIAIVDGDGKALDGLDQWMRTIFIRTGGDAGIFPQVSPLLTALGAGQADALGLTFEWSRFGTVPAGTGCRAPILNPGQEFRVWNKGANALAVYPWVGARIDALAVNTPYSLPINKMQLFSIVELNLIYSAQPG